MAKTKATDEGKTQRQKFIEAAREHGADGDELAFRRALLTVATAVTKPKKASRKTKR